MREFILKRFLSYIIGVQKVDCYIYENGEEKDSFLRIGDPFCLRSGMIEELSEKGLFVLNTAPDISFAKIPIENSDTVIYLGPCKTSAKSGFSSQQTLDFFCLPPSVYDEFNTYLSYLPIISFSNFSSLVLAIYAAVNDAQPDAFDALTVNVSSGAKSTKPLPVKTSLFAESERTQSWKFEIRLFALIQNGLVEELRDFLDTPEKLVSAPQIAESTLRQMQNLVECLITTNSRVAMSGGVPPLIGYDLSDRLFLRVENATTIDELIAVAMKVPILFATKVREFSSIKTDNLIVKKAIRFIRDNPKTKLTVGTIAKELGICQTYLSSQFSAETGMNIPTFVKRHRMLYAKYYLQFTKLSLAEIADALCFSSQSAFQNAFKEIVGTTPAAYRAEQST